MSEKKTPAIRFQGFTDDWEAYDHPKFVEDILRDVVLALRDLPGIAHFSVACENFESIHNHNAYASHEETVSP